MQLFCTGASYCDFIVYTSESIHIERIYLNTKFLESNIVKTKDFFEKGILPELLGKWFTRSTQQTSVCVSEAGTSIMPSQSRYCYCQEGEQGDMIGCDNERCPYKINGFTWIV